MSVERTLTATTHHLRRLHSHITRQRAALFAVTLVVVGLALGGLEKPAAAVQPAYHTVTDLMLPARVPSAPGADAPQPVSQEALSERLERVEVRPGQSLDAIFREQGFSVGLLQQILALNDETRALKRIRPGEQFAFQRHPDGSLSRMRYALGEDRYLWVDNFGDTPVAYTEARELSSQMFETEGTIQSSLFLAGKRSGLSDAMVMKLANIFGWDIDFVLDIRSGDRFYLLYEKIYRDGEYLRDGEILAATFVNQGERYQAVRYEADNGPQYYAPDGRHMRKAFLRAPLNFSYISSNFNPKRFHPILRRVKAHNGIDYRAPKGTPVYAAGDGHVTRSTYDKYNGHHVFIQHANSIVTKYLHFSRRAVNRGERVRQGQVIGYVGATGLAEAPHLHYEFLVNGQHRNPRTVPLPEVRPLEGQYLVEFQHHAAPYLNQLGRLEAASLYAARE